MEKLKIFHKESAFVSSFTEVTSVESGGKKTLIKLALMAVTVLNILVKKR